MEDDKEEKRGFKVEDRRRFSETGDARVTSQEETPDEPNVADAPSIGATTAPPQREASPLEINFSTLLLSLSTQALAHLGEIPDPVSQRVEVDLGAAKQMIDILGILKDKTTGNLEEGEAALIDAILYDLRLKYVERADGLQRT